MGDDGSRALTIWATIITRMLVALWGQSLKALIASHQDDLRHLGLCHYLIAVPDGCNIMHNLMITMFEHWWLFIHEKWHAVINSNCEVIFSDNDIQRATIVMCSWTMMAWCVVLCSDQFVGTMINDYQDSTSILHFPYNCSSLI